jgi:hypothetical protein
MYRETLTPAAFASPRKPRISSTGKLNVRFSLGAYWAR